MTSLLNDRRTRLVAYLGSAPSYFRVLASGWETIVFEFSLTARPGVCRELPLRRPLALRLYQGSRADEKGAREARMMTQLADLHYPVPRPYLYEPDHQPLGAPFLIMERVDGGPLFSPTGFARAFRTFMLGFPAFVRTQAELHQLANAGKLAPEIARSSLAQGRPRGDTLRADGSAGCAHNDSSSPLLQRVLDTIGERIERAPLPGLREGLARLREQAARFSPASEALVHMDYHPQNVIVRGRRVTGVIDWVNADRGDRHLCAATTAVILSSSVMEQPRWMRANAIGNTLRALFAASYVPLYHALAPMELRRFRFAEAVAAMLRLSMFGMMRVRGAESIGFRREATDNITPSLVHRLSRYTARKLKVPASIEPQ